MTDDQGMWVDASDPLALATILVVGKRHLGGCLSINETARMVEVDVMQPVPGEWPVPAFCDNRAVTLRLGLGDDLEVYHDGGAHPVEGWRWWTEQGWVNEKSESIEGPTPSIVKEFVAGENLEADQAVRIRNGRVYRA